MKRFVQVEAGRALASQQMKTCRGCGKSLVLCVENFRHKQGKGWHSQCLLCEAIKKARRVNEKKGAL
jgi:hypothetical protein